MLHADIRMNTNQVYTLDIAAPVCTISADSYAGALHAMESFTQLVDLSTADDRAVNATTVSDAPRYNFRAFLVDTSRHYYPLQYILKHLDAMAMTKMNVLHWHIVDSQSFPYVSKAFPELSAAGAWAPDHVYTPDDVAKVIEYAKARGIRVMPEFDTPGHVQAGFTALPGLLTQCYDATTGKPDGTTGPLDPTNDAVYDFLTKFYAEVKSVFPDQYVHVGGDEVPFECWQSNPDITKWMAAQNMSSYSELEQYYELKLLDILKAQNSSYMCWQEIFDNGVAILPDTIVNVWKGAHNASDWQRELKAVAKAGYRAVLSAPWYLNYISYGQDWQTYYSTEPEAGSAEDSLFGVEACMWSEYVDGTNFIPRTWPRTAAVAERAWSAKDVTDIDDASARLNELRCKMLGRGIRAEPLFPSYCAEEWTDDHTFETGEAGELASSGGAVAGGRRVRAGSATAA